jgi:uncharacterized protein YciI
MSHHILFYEYVEDVLERRAPYREAHLERIRARDDIVMAGALGDPPHAAVIIFKDTDPEQIEEFVRSDPYVAGGLVVESRIEVYRLV